MMRWMHWLLALPLSAVLALANAQSLRDPTLSPVDPAIAGAPAPGDSLPVAAGITNLVVRDGRRYLVVGTRLYAQGEKLGQARIERISETEVWLREAGELRKVQRFNGVERRAVVSSISSPGCARSGLAPKPGPRIGRAVKPARTHKSSPGLDKAGLQITSPAVEPCVGVRP